MLNIFEQLEQEAQGIQPGLTAGTFTNTPQQNIFDILEAEGVGPIPGELSAPPSIPAVTPSAQPSTFEQVARPAIEALASIGGSVVGAVAAGPPGAFAGGTLGFAAARELNDLLFGEEDQGTLGDELLEAGENILEGAKLEAMGLIGGKLLTPLGKAMFRGGKFTAQQVARLRSAQKLDVPITLGEATDTYFTKGSEDFFRKMALPRIIPGAKFQTFDARGFKALLKAHNDLLDNITRGKISSGVGAVRIEALNTEIQSRVNKLLAGKVAAKGAVLDKLKTDTLAHYGSPLTWQELSETGQRTLERHQLNLEALASSFFDSAKARLPLGGADVVDTSKVTAAVTKALKAIQELPGSDRALMRGHLQSIANDFMTPAVVATATSPGKSAVRAIPYNTFVARRGVPGAMAANIKKSVGIPGGPQVVMTGKKLARFLTPVQQAVNETLSDFAKASGTDVDMLVRSGLATARRKFDFVKSPIVKRLMKSNPEQMLDILLKPGQTSAMKSLRSELTPTQIQPLQKAAVNKILSTVDEPLTGAVLKKHLKDSGTSLKELIDQTDYAGLDDLSRKLITQERSIARLQTTGSLPRGLALDSINLAGNKFYKQLIRNQKPQNLVDIVYQPGNTRNIKRTYAALRATKGQEAVQDLKAALIERNVVIDPISGNILLKETSTNLNRLGDDTLRAALSPDEFAGLKDLERVIDLVKGREASWDWNFWREVAEPIAAPMSWIYLRRDGRNQLKKVARMLISDATRDQKNAALTKLFLIGTRAAAQARERQVQIDGQ